jgi:hypothetical protein
MELVILDIPRGPLRIRDAMFGLQFRFLHVPEAPEGLKAIPHSGFVDIQKTMIPQRRCYIANVTRQQTPRQVTYRRKSARTSIATRARLPQKQAAAGTRLCQKLCQNPFRLGLWTFV